MADASLAVLAAPLALVVGAGLGVAASHLLGRRRTRGVESARNDLLGRLALLADFKHHRTRERSRAVARTAGLMARRLGLPPAQAREIRLASQFHDIGKLALPDAVLLKEEGGLTAQEREVVESHTLVGAELLSGASGVLAVAAEIALGHHERWDGSGYPHGLRGEEIPLAARIVAVADVFHTLVERHASRQGSSVEMAVAEIERSAGVLFDPAVVDAFSALSHHALVRRDGAVEGGSVGAGSSG